MLLERFSILTPQRDPDKEQLGHHPKRFLRVFCAFG